MSFSNPANSNISNMTNILSIIVKERVAAIEPNTAVTLKDIYGDAFWSLLKGLEARRLGYRFRCICEELGFAFTDTKRSKANLYIKII
jgi:hypothetical protein